LTFYCFQGYFRVVSRMACGPGQLYNTRKGEDSNTKWLSLTCA
jgi:hypothetical protein